MKAAIYTVIVLVVGALLMMNVARARLRKTIREVAEQPGTILKSDRGHDFIMSSQTAVSNAVQFQAPPKGWNIFCDDQGHYVPAYEDFVVLIEAGVTVRTSRFEAIVAAWRTKEIWDTPRELDLDRPKPYSTNRWQICEPP